jgi:membrane associated rhomboid family serine protease
MSSSSRLSADRFAVVALLLVVLTIGVVLAVGTELPAPARISIAAVSGVIAAVVTRALVRRRDSRSR